MNDKKFMFDDEDDGWGRSCQTLDENDSDTIIQNHWVIVGNDCEMND